MIVRRAARLRSAPALALLALLAGVAPLPALQLSGGPVDTPPNGGSCAMQNPAPDGTAVTFACTVTDPGAFTDLYFGIDNTTKANGMAMDGAAPNGREIFRYSSSTPQSITYTSSTTVDSQASGAAQNVNNRLVLTLLAGDGVVIDTGGTPANNPNGDVQKLFRISSNTFSVRVEVTGNTLPVPTFGPPNANIFDIVKPPPISSITSVSLGFYYLSCQS